MDDKSMEKQSVGGIYDNLCHNESDGFNTQPEERNEAYWLDIISSIKKIHQEELSHTIIQFNERLASTLKTGETEYEHKLESKLKLQAEIHANIVACIEDELETERSNHTLTKQEHVETQQRSDAIITELHSRLSLFEQIEATNALANHITEMC